MIADSERVERVTFYANPQQLEVLTSDKWLTFFGGGVGCGKTSVGVIWDLMRVAEAPDDVIGILAANTYSQLYDATLRNTLKHLRELHVPHRPTELPRVHSPLTLEIWNGKRWVELLCRSMESAENLSGVEVGWARLDEVWQTEESAFNIIAARVRDTRMRNRILLTTTLDDPSSWMYERFVDRFDESRMQVTYAPTHANAKNLPAGYAEDLRSVYSGRQYDRMVLAKWVTLSSGQVYYAFDRGRNVSITTEFDPALPVLWTHDYNIGQDKPMSSAVCQIGKGTDAAGKIRLELRVLDEIILDSSDTHDAVNEFKARGWPARAKAGVRIYGDASGKARDTRSKLTDYSIIADAGFPNQRVPAANPPLRDRHNAVNALLRNAAGDVRLLIAPNCRTVAKGFETVKLKSGAQYLEEESREQHVTTAVGYLVCVEFPVTSRRSGTTEMPF